MSLQHFIIDKTIQRKEIYFLNNLILSQLKSDYQE